MQVASHLKLTVWEAKSKLSYSEFILWCQYLKTEHERPTLDHYYLAQIAREVRVVLYKAADAKKFKINDFLISFEEKKPPAKQRTVEVSSPNEIERRTKISQAPWFALLGLNKDGTKKEPKDGKANSTRRTSSSRNRKR